MRISAKELKNVVVFYLNEDVTIETVKNFRKTVDSFLNKDVSNVLFDFSGTEYICSEGLGVIANIYKTISGHGGKVYATNIMPTVERVFRVTTLDKFVIIRPDTEEVIKNLESIT